VKYLPRIVVSKNGPYIVYGSIPLSVQTMVPNKDGESWDWKEGKTLPSTQEFKLCRCGRSKNKPFCDDTHKTTHFDGTETATRRPFMREAETYEGPTLTLRDSEALCAFARFCHPGGGIWKLVEKSDAPDARELATREANHCPSGRLVMQETGTDRELEEALRPSIGVVEDPMKGCSGPLWVRGGISIESEGGVPYETRNRVTLCRCGLSSNKPFCNGSHTSIKFRDGLVDFGERAP
jgi:CDGSH-type Zn-finger protein